MQKEKNTLKKQEEIRKIADQYPQYYEPRGDNEDDQLKHARLLKKSIDEYRAEHEKYEKKKLRE